MRASVCLALSIVAGCDQLSGSFIQPNPLNCATSGSDCNSGTSCNRMTGHCDPVAAVSPKPTPLCNPGGFCWENPLPQGNDLYRAWGRAPNDVWFVGAYGTLLHCKVGRGLPRRPPAVRRARGSADGLIPSEPTHPVC